MRKACPFCVVCGRGRTSKDIDDRGLSDDARRNAGPTKIDLLLLIVDFHCH